MERARVSTRIELLTQGRDNGPTMGDHLGTCRRRIGRVANRCSHSGNGTLLPTILRLAFRIRDW